MKLRSIDLTDAIAAANEAKTGRLERAHPGCAITGRVKTRWGSSAAYQSGVPGSVRWPGGKLGTPASLERSGIGNVPNTAVKAVAGAHRQVLPGARQRPKRVAVNSPCPASGRYWR